MRLVPSLVAVAALCSLSANYASADPALSFEKAPGAAYIARISNSTVTVAATGVELFAEEPAGHLRVRFQGANPNAAAQPGARLPGRINYYLGNDPSKWRTGVKLVDSVAFRNVYRGIDVFYHGAGDDPNQNRLAIEYDFHLAPGIDAKQIRIAFDTPVRLTRDGSLVASGNLTIQKPPIAYQILSGKRVDLPVRMIPAGRNQFSFALGPHDTTASVVIDPVLVFSTYLGGSGTDQAWGITVDGSGNSYVTGPTNSPNFPIVGSSSPPAGSEHVFVSKFDPTGKLVFSTVIGGSDYDYGVGIDVDEAGNILVTGTTLSSNFPIYPSNAFQTSLGNGGSAFVLKLSPSGQLLGSTFLGGQTFGAYGNTCPYGSSADSFGVAHDPAGNIYATGEVCVTDFPTHKGISTRLIGQDACFIIELDPTLVTAVYSTYLGGLNTTWCNGIAVDSAGNAYVAGDSTSSGLATSGAFQTQVAGGSSYGDGFVAKIQAGGQSIVYFTYLGGANDDSINRLAIDSAGDAYVTGWTQSANFPLKNPLQSAYNGAASGATLPYGGEGGDGFITEVNPNGTGLVYSTYFGGNGMDFGYAIAVDSSGNTYVGGATTSSNLQVTAGAIQSKLANPNAENGFVIEIAPQGTSLEYSTYLGGSGQDVVYALDATNAGNIYVAGTTNSPNFPTAQAYQSSLAGTRNAFVTEIGTATFSLVINSLTNGASFANAPAVSPGSLVTIFAATGVSQPEGSSSTPLPLTLGGVSVTINGNAAPLVYVNSTQVNFQLPNEVLPGSATAVLESGTATSKPFPFMVSAAAPGIFTYGSNQAVAQNYPSYSLNGSSAPATAGGVVIVYLTGIGPVDNPVGDGVLTPASPLSSATSKYSATINQMDAPVSFLGLTPGFVGLAQADVAIPAGLKTGNYPFVITVDGTASKAAMIAVQ